MRPDLRELYIKYKDFTMVPEKLFYDNLKLCEKYMNIKGSIVECGVWRGGISAAIAELIGTDRTYYLLDSFKGLPPAREIDGNAAIKWQNAPEGKYYYDNCTAKMENAEQSMKMTGVKNYKIISGWFNDTLPGLSLTEKIAILRLDADWYDSTIICLQYLFTEMAPGGIIIIDDYYTWDGCSKAVHDYLSENKHPERIYQYNNSICYIVKR